MAKKEILNNDAVTLRVGESVADVFDDVSDVIEKTLDVLETQTERVVTVTKNNPLVLAGVLLVGVVIGGFVSYKITQKRLGAQFDEELTEQITAAKQFHMRMAKEGEFATPELALKALNADEHIPDVAIEALTAYQGREMKVPYNKPDTIVDLTPEVAATVVSETVVVATNVFDATQSDPRDWDYNAELADRELNPGVPYVISFDEHNENEKEYEQVSMTYYEKDDMLVDAADKPIDSTDYTVGDDNLNRFGEGSGDPNVVYVRNDTLEMDFEVVKDKGSYHMAAFGTEPDPDILHSRRRPNRQGWRADE